MDEPRAARPQSGSQLNLARLAMLHAQGRWVRSLDLGRVDLRKRDLTGLRGDDLHLEAANLGGASLRKARLVGCDLRDADLVGVDLTGATLRMCALDGARAVGLLGANARIEDSSLQGTDLTTANLHGSHLTETSFARASMSRIRLDGAQGDGVTFRGADLRDATFLGARLSAADFRGADLSHADLTGADVRGADFRGALLHGVTWAGAQVAGAHFDADEAPAVEPRPAGDVEGARSSTAPADDVADALTALIQQAIATTGRRVPGRQQHADAATLLGPELRRVAASWEAWQSQGDGTGEVDPGALTELVTALERSLVETGAAAPGVMGPYAQLLHLLGRADGPEPPAELKEMLEPLLAGGDRGDDDVEALASRLLSVIGAAGEPSGRRAADPRPRREP